MQRTDEKIMQCSHQTEQLSRADAQLRIDRISAFTAELDELQKLGLITLSVEDKARISAHHQAISERLSKLFDVDLNAGAKQLSLGMRIVSFLGAAALAASVFFLFYQYWGLIDIFWQCVILIAAPVISLSVAIYIR